MRNRKTSLFFAIVILVSSIRFASARQYWNPDLSGQDSFVNFGDFAVFAKNWQKSGSGLAGDFDDNGSVDVNDLAYFAYYWLKEIHFEYVPGQVLVGFKPDITQSTVEDLAGSLNCSIIRRLRKRNVYLWKVKGINREEEVINQLQTNPDVLYAERNGLAYPSGQKIPNDPSFNLQWNLHQPSNADINAPEGWYEIDNKFGRVGDPNIVIAIIDTGVDYAHPDLSARMWIDSNGHYGYDFVNDDNYPIDDDGHGTHVAGIAAADTNNSIGVAGVSWGCRIMAVKVLPAVGGGSYADIADGVDYAVDNDANVINMSFEGTMSSLALENAINDAHDANVVLVAAAGNSTDDLDINKHYPACYDKVICVSATDSNDQYTSFTNYGSYVGVAAPGEGIYSTLRNNTYGYMSGTSMAAPHVSGLAALCLSICPYLPPELVKAYITGGVDDLGTVGKDDYYGWGRISVFGTVSAVDCAPDLYTVLHEQDESTRKLSSSGIKQWGYDTSRTVSVAIDNYGNVYVTGNGTTDPDKNVWKLDNSGNKQWDWDTGGYGKGIAVDTSGNVYITGWRVNDKNVWKLNSSGTKIADYDTGNAGAGIALDSSGNVYIAGGRNNNKSVWKIGSWSYDTGSSTRDIAVDSSGNVYVVGNRSPDGKSVWKLNSAGVKQWDYDTGNGTRGIAIDRFGNVYIAGNASGSKCVWKLNSAGVKLWDYGLGTSTHANGIAVDDLGNVYFGTNQTYPGNDGYLVKLNSSGIIQWSYHVSMCCYDVAVRVLP